MVNPMASLNFTGTECKVSQKDSKTIEAMHSRLFHAYSVRLKLQARIRPQAKTSSMMEMEHMGALREYDAQHTCAICAACDTRELS